MGMVRRLIQRFFGPPSEARFASMVAATLRKAGDPRTCTYDPQAFRLVFTEGEEQSGTINLRNIYTEYCKTDKPLRAQMLRHACRAFINSMEIPSEFEDAKHDLLPTLRTRSLLEISRLEALLQGGKQFELAWSPLTDHLVICLVYDLPNAMQFVNEEQLETWGITPYEALEVALQNLAERSFAMLSLGESVFVFQNGDSYDATRLLLKDKISQLELKGQPVAMPVTREMLLITGADDIDGLGMMVGIAESQADEARPLCAIPLILNDGEWETWLPPPDHEHFDKFRLLETKYLYGEYAEQKTLLEQRNEQTATDVFVASYGAMEREGVLSSWALWLKDCTTWLPQTHLVAFTDPDTNLTGLAPWERVRAVVGHRMQPLDLYPPRWLIDDFPTPQELAELGLEMMEKED